jgi:hypothetical protein
VTATFVNPARIADLAEEQVSVESIRANVMQTVALHTVMFEKLLFQGTDLPLSLAELFEDVANTYFTFSDSIGRLHSARLSRIENGSDPSVVFTG